MKSKNIYSLPIKIKDEIIAFSDIRVHCGIEKYAVDFPLKKNVPIFTTQSGLVIEKQKNKFFLQLKFKKLIDK